MDRLEAMAILLRVVQAGSLSEAARQLGMSLATVSRRLSELEAHLQAQVLNRSSRRLSLTDAGRLYVEACKRILDQVEEAERSMVGVYKEPKGRLTITAPVVFGRVHVIPIVSQFLAEYPDIDLKLILADRLLDMLETNIDVAVRIGEPAQDPGLIVRKLAENRRIVVASHAYLERMGTPTAPVDLAAHHCLRFPYRQGRQSWVFSRDGHTEKVEVNGRLTANSLDILREGVLNGQGIALVPAWLVQHDIVAGEMLSLFDAWSVQPLTGDAQVYAAYLPNRRHSRKVQTFIAFLAERIRGALAS